MGLISPGGENLLEFLELRKVLSTYDGDLKDPLWWTLGMWHDTGVPLAFPVGAPPLEM